MMHVCITYKHLYTYMFLMEKRINIFKKNFWILLGPIHLFEREISACVYAMTKVKKTQNLLDEFSYSFNFL